MLHNNNQIADLLKQEIERSYSSLNKYYTNIIQVIIILITLLGGLLTYVYFSENPPIFILFFSPLPILAIFAVLMILLYQAQAMLFFIRDTSEEIKKITGSESFHLFFDKESIPSKLQSTQRGLLGLRTLQAGLIVIAFIIFGVLIIQNFILIYEDNHFISFLFIIFYLASVLWACFGLFGLSVEFPKTYKYLSKNNKFNNFSLPKFNFLSYLLPRPIDFFTKSIIFFAGCVIAFLESKFKYPASLDNYVLSPVSSSMSLGLIVYALIWFVLQEIFIQQSKYIWNDIRDRNRDMIIPVNKNRPLQKRNIGKITYISLFSRWFIGLYFSYLFSKKLFILLIFISVIQVAYELWAKPISSKLPIASLYIVGIGSFFRFLGGSLAVGWDVGDPRLFAYAFSFFIFSATYGVVFWKVEAKYMQKENIQFQRGQSQYFVDNYNYWYFILTTALTFLLISIILDSTSGIYYDLQTNLLINILINASLGFVLIFFLKFVISSFTRKFPDITLKIEIIPWKIPLLLFLSSFIVISLSNDFDQIIVSSLIVPVLFSALMLYILHKISGLTYSEFTFGNAIVNFPILKNIYFNYLFTSDTSIQLRQLIKLTFSINHESFQKIIKTNDLSRYR